ncbi:hypothetical protein H7Y29_00495 [Microbacteriaceae bacterium]|nr:hypothetical protein [Candidatus Saccharibacteria bacterium]
MTSTSWRYAVVNTLGTLGYLSIIVQWTWCVITLGQPLLSADKHLYLPQAPVPPVSHVIDFGILAPFVPVLALLVTVIIIVLTVVTLVRLPKAVGKTGSNMTHAAASQIIKKTHRHHSLPIKKRNKLSFWIIWLLKSIAVYVPFALVFITPAVDGLTTRLVTTVSFACAVLSTFYFVLQLSLSFILKLDKKKIW